MSQDSLRDHLEFFQELGVDGMRTDAEWRTRRQPDPLTQALDPTVSTEDLGRQASAEPVTVFSSSAEALAAIKADIGPDCSRCKLHTLGRKQVVFGVGNPNADLMFVGEAPGADEDIQGEPFVGRAGQLLTKIIEAIGLKREDVYIANVIKCRPPGNRNPEPDEVEQCEPFLFRQVDTIKPKVIVALGKFAAQCLLRTDTPITRIRGKEFAYRDAILMPTYHPAYLLRNPSAKRDVWEDMKRVRSILSSA
ncbi:MAG TPA: uracil-DNA glycosylase [Vicinamibacterales bacterium]|jgi:DNA polymerase|nr:uracil-DNA glycosylase [Vicinamibacterales bacterium]